MRVLMLACIFLLCSCDVASRGGDHNGFDLSNSSVPIAEILHGGPGRDGIPALNNPRFDTLQQATSKLEPQQRLLGLVIADQARAYPINIMNWHEIVNDEVAGQPLLISYCPLCGTGMAFSRQVGEQVLSFGVSGLLYNSDVLMYDHQTESLWSQIRAEAISGPLRGRRLQQLPLQLTHWQYWQAQHRNTQVLSEHTGFWRDYDEDPYLGYEQSNRTYFPVSHTAPENWHPKQWVSGVSINGESRAWPHAELKRLNAPLAETVGGRSLLVQYHHDSQSVSVTDKTGAYVQTITAYLFAWHTFHPDGTLFRAE